MKHKGAFLATIAAIAVALLGVPSPGAAAASHQPGALISPASPAGSVAGQVNVGIRRESGVVTPAARPFLTLQMNLCNSGHAGCYEDGKSIPEAYRVILDWAPALVTLNEICLEDVRTLFEAMLQLWPNEYVFYAFRAAGDRRTPGQPFTCTNGDSYGIGMLGRLFTSSPPDVKPYWDLYPDNWTTEPRDKWLQDPNQNELRAWLCVDANRAYYGCTTHLRRHGGQIALNQCNFLTKGVVALLHAGRYLPTVVAGDLNLRYAPGEQFNVQKCVPSGWFRKGDGAVQHTMATDDFTFNGTHPVPMTYTDHPAWVVSLTKP